MLSIKDAIDEKAKVIEKLTKKQLLKEYLTLYNISLQKTALIEYLEDGKDK